MARELVIFEVDKTLLPKFETEKEKDEYLGKLKF